MVEVRTRGGRARDTVFRQRPRGNANLGSRMPNERASLLRDNGLYAACRVHAAKGRDRYRQSAGRNGRESATDPARDLN